MNQKEIEQLEYIVNNLSTSIRIICCKERELEYAENDLNNARKDQSNNMYYIKALESTKLSKTFLMKHNIIQKDKIMQEFFDYVDVLKNSYTSKQNND